MARSFGGARPGPAGSPRGVETFCAFIAERHEALDVLVNNACQTVRRFVFRHPSSTLVYIMPIELRVTPRWVRWRGGASARCTPAADARKRDTI